LRQGLLKLRFREIIFSDGFGQPISIPKVGHGFIDVRFMGRFSIPSVVKHNTLHLAASQAVFRCVAQTTSVVAPLVVYALTGSVMLSGLVTSVIYGGRVLIVYQTGKLMDRFGRNVVLVLGIVMGSLAVLLMGWAAIFDRLELFWVGLLVFGFGLGVTQQSRVAVMDMYPLERRGEGLGYLMMGNVIGALLSPIFIAAIIPITNLFVLNLYGVIFLISMPLLAASSIFIMKVKPDPMEIGLDLRSYYPHLELAGGNGRIQDNSMVHSILLFPILVAFVVSSLAWGEMSIMTSLLPLVLHHYDVVLTLISLSVTLHTVGMFVFSVPFGRLSDQIGRKWVLVLGCLLLGIGAFLTPIAANYAIITLGVILLGLGWSATNVATSAIISDLTRPERRGQMLGANDVATGLASLSLPILGGAVMVNLGLFALGILGSTIALLALLISLPLREVSLGKYVDSK